MLKAYHTYTGIKEDKTNNRNNKSYSDISILTFFFINSEIFFRLLYCERKKPCFGIPPFAGYY